jgi:hypothetical protein
MTLGEVVFWYSAIILVLLLALGVLLFRRKAAFTQLDWHRLFGSKGKTLTGDIWLKLFLATFIALFAGVIIAVCLLQINS